MEQQEQLIRVASHKKKSQNKLIQVLMKLCITKVKL